MTARRVDNAGLATLMVSMAGAREPVCSHPHAHRLTCTFTGNDRGDGFSAWEVEQTPHTTVVEVHSDCASFIGGYSQQALNRFVANAILRHRPGLVIVCGLYGCTLDLPRVAALLGVPCVLYLSGQVESPLASDAWSAIWARAALEACTGCVCAEPVDVESYGALAGVLKHHVKPVDDLHDIVASIAQAPSDSTEFSYSMYELCSRDNPLLVRMQEPDAVHFAGLNRVLDVGCGAGLFLEVLKRKGVEASGVERNADIARYGQGMGLQINNQDALAFLAEGEEKYDGMYCCHFVEHLPIEGVETLIRLMFSRLEDEGILVLVFPDPESIRSQLLGFWRDPEHVRFYHPELILSIATLAGFDTQWTSYQEQPHTVVPFQESPSEVSAVAPFVHQPVPVSSPAQGLWERLLEKLGMAPARRVQELEGRLQGLAGSLAKQFSDTTTALEQLEQRTDTLWNVNKTWAWNDNVTIKLRKRRGAV